MGSDSETAAGDIILRRLHESSVFLGIAVIDSQIVAVRSPLAGKTACLVTVRSNSLGHGSAGVAEWKKHQGSAPV